MATESNGPLTSDYQPPWLNKALAVTNLCRSSAWTALFRLGLGIIGKRCELDNITFLNLESLSAMPLLRLEICCTACGTGGSNPSLSAN
jgi:hypothetical protein